MTTAFEMFEDLARRGVFTPAQGLEPFTMPTMLQPVPTITTYGTSDPVTIGAHDNAGLEARSSGNRGRAGQAD